MGKNWEDFLNENWNFVSVCFDQKWNCAKQALRIIRKKFKKMEFCFGQKISQFVTESRRTVNQKVASSVALHLVLNGQF